ncbi:MAG: hypothetical protein ACI959_002208 [Limisphaerales bacterium]|jgi:uncharacterized protein YjiK
MIQFSTIIKGSAFVAFAILFYLLLVQLSSTPVEEHFPLQSKVIPYDLFNPETVWYTGVPEISGIAYTEQGFAVVQDELARIDFLSLDKGEIQSFYSFGKRGDYEDITAIGESFLVLRSDGLLIKVDAQNEKQENVKTDLPASANLEGLWFDPSDSILWAASKHRGKNNSRKDRTIYTAKYKFKNKKELNFHNQFELKGKEVSKIYNTDLLSKIEKRRTTNGVVFQPAAIAKNPLTGDLWILSGDPSGILICSKKGKIKSAFGISSTMWPQPEGMAFAPDGTLYIASEITNAIYVYKPK